SSDAAATLPANAPLVSGVGSFSTALKTAGVRTLVVADTASAAVTGATSVQVRALPASQFAVSAPAAAAAGSPVTVTVTALDPYGNVATGYSGSVHFASSDANATLPADAPVAGGVASFSVTPRTAGTLGLTVTDTAAASVAGSAGVQVSPLVATHFALSAPTTTAAGATLAFTVTALDVYGNTATGYAGTVHFTSTDASALLPADATLTAGVGMF